MDNTAHIYFYAAFVDLNAVQTMVEVECYILDQLLTDMQAKCGIDRKQAETAVGLAMCYLAARLPSPVMGRIKTALTATPYPTNVIQSADCAGDIR